MKVDWFLIGMVAFILVCLSGMAPTEAAAYGYRMPSEMVAEAPKFRRHADFNTAMDCAAYHFILGRELSDGQKTNEHIIQGKKDMKAARAMNETGTGTMQLFMKRVMDLQAELKTEKDLMAKLHGQCPIEE